VIERIYIPTIRRTDNQISFNNLPKELQRKVIMVVESGERHLYNYDCEYLELPEKIVGEFYQLAETRKFIYEHAGTIKYAVMDDDLIIRRRNSKYWTGKSNMEKSKRDAIPDEILLAFDTCDKWLDEPDIGIVGLTDQSIGAPPPPVEYQNTVFVAGLIFIDGAKVQQELHDMDITSVRIAEDLIFIYECLSRGINTRKSIEWMFTNGSAKKGMTETSLSGTGHNSSDLHYDALKYIQTKFPKGIKLYEKDGIRKNRKYCKKVYTPKLNTTLTDFMQ